MTRGILLVVRLDLDDRAADAVDEERHADEVGRDLVHRPGEEVTRERVHGRRSEAGPGRARAMTSVPTTQPMPPETIEKRRLVELRDDAGLEVAERRRARDLGELDPAEAAAHVVGRHGEHDRRPEDRAHLVGGAGDAEQQRARTTACA